MTLFSDGWLQLVPERVLPINPKVVKSPTAAYLDWQRVPLCKYIRQVVVEVWVLGALL